MLEETGVDDDMELTLIGAIRTNSAPPGDQFTAADVMLRSSANFMEIFEMLPATRNPGAYAARCRARPAFERSMAMGAA
jgi:hypothetical protein